MKKTATEPHLHVKLVGSMPNTVDIKTQCFEGLKKFQSGDFDVKNEEHGKPLGKCEKFVDNELQVLLDGDDTQPQQELTE